LLTGSLINGNISPLQPSSLISQCYVVFYCIRVVSNKTSLRRNFCKTKRSSPSHRPSSLCRCVTQNQCDVRPYRTRRTLASTKLCCLVTGQWSFLKTGTNGTLAGQAEIYVWFQTPGGGGGVFGRGLPLLLQGPGPPKKCHCI